MDDKESELFSNSKTSAWGCCLAFVLLFPNLSLVMLIKKLLIKESVYSMIVLLLIRQFSVIWVFRYIIDSFLINFPCFSPWKHQKPFGVLVFSPLSWRRSLSYRNQFIDLLCKSMDWFLYDRDLLHERAKMYKMGIFAENGSMPLSKIAGIFMKRMFSLS